MKSHFTNVFKYVKQGIRGIALSRCAFITHHSARIQTALINIQVSKYHRDKTRTVESARKVFCYRRSISRQVRISNPCVRIENGHLTRNRSPVVKMLCEQIQLL